MLILSELGLVPVCVDFYLLAGGLLSSLLLRSLPPLDGRTATFGRGGGANRKQATGWILLVDFHMSEIDQEERNRATRSDLL